MKKYLDLRNEIDNEKIREAAEIIKGGGLVVFPTETVYGIGANGLNANAVEKIFIAKQRKKDNPLILLISSKEMLNKIVEDINEVETKLIESFWPGPLTIILKKNEALPGYVTNNKDSIAIRIPDDETVLKILNELDNPILLTSANKSGEDPALNSNQCYEVFNGEIPFIIKGECLIKEASTIIDLTDGEIKLIREGKISLEDIRKEII